MDYKFLNKVIDQIVYETRIDYDRKVIGTPLHPIPFRPPLLSHSLFFSLIFSRHCKGVYGLNEQEIDYVWEEYRNIVLYKIKNNGV